ncbi:MAG TPA: hypothetical protein VIR31_07805 [Nitrososphaeraceae archaeon]
MEFYPTEIECTDQSAGVNYFKIKMFDACSAEIKSDVCIGSIKELDEYLENIRKSFIQMFPEWDEAIIC